MVKTKLPARRSYQKTCQLPAWMLNKEYGRKRNIYPFKIKQTLPAQSTVNITKNRQVVKTINVRRKYRYFNEKYPLIF